MRFFAYTVLLTTFLISCGDGRHTINQTQTGGGGGGGGSILGNWAQSCAQIDTSHQTVNMTITDSTFQSSTSIYTAAGCTTRAMTQVMSGSYTGGNAVTGGTAIDLNPTSLSITANHDDYVGIFNAISMCGYTDWQKDVARNCNSLAAPIYQIYGVNGNTAYLGKIDDAHDASSAAKRPVQLLTTAPYTRQ